MSQLAEATLLSSHFFPTMPNTLVLSPLQAAQASLRHRPPTYSKAGANPRDVGGILCLGTPFLIDRAGYISYFDVETI